MARRRHWEPDRSQVMVVAAGRYAHEQAEKFRVYNCQNRRRFKAIGWIAFYANGKIDLLAEIAAPPEDDVMIAHRPELTEIADHAGHRPYLSRTIVPLKNVTSIKPILNDKKDKHGRDTAWTQSQRYTTLDRIKMARTTADLDVGTTRSRYRTIS